MGSGKGHLAGGRGTQSMAQTEPETSTCRECGRQMRWARSPGGRKIPLSRVTQVYVVAPASDGVDEAIPLRTLATNVGNADVYVSHFVNCTNPGRFSKRGKS